ncbi:MAG: hypothetical protein J7K54_03950 [Candidatus Aenigmarchaeota archaeon]|nr:hypothetical protein [Candidatus Aenigmarchaeota archaeon]
MEKGLAVLSIVFVVLVSGCIQHGAPETGPPGSASQPAGQAQFTPVNPSHPPRFVRHDFIELDKIAMVSRFRSGVGHDFSRGEGETGTCRSMKHYFEPKGVDESLRQKEHEGLLTADDWPVVHYYAPVNGTIIDMRPVENEYGQTEKQFILQSEEHPDIWFGFFHVITAPGLRKGSIVKAGDFLGTISPGNSGEIAVSVIHGQDEQLISFFDVLADDAFAEYQARGAGNRSDFIISKEERDSNPLVCDTEEPHRFTGSSRISDKSAYDKWSMGTDNWVMLS